MKKTLAGIVTAALVLALMTTSAFAAGPGRGGQTPAAGTGCGRYYTDADGDGVCDFCAGNAAGCAAGTGCGRYCVDADGDGVCDFRAGTGARPQDGTGQRHGFQGGRNR